MGIEPYIPDLIDASEVREHILFLQSKGIGAKGVSLACSINPRFIRDIAVGSVKRLKRQNAVRILAVPAINNLPGQYVPSAEGKQMFADLLALGYNKSDIASRVLGKPAKTMVFKDHIRVDRLNRLRKVYTELTGHKSKQQQPVS